METQDTEAVDSEKERQFMRDYESECECEEGGGALSPVLNGWRRGIYVTPGYIGWQHVCHCGATAMLRVVDPF